MYNGFVRCVLRAVALCWIFFYLYLHLFLFISLNNKKSVLMLLDSCHSLYNPPSSFFFLSPGLLLSPFYLLNIGWTDPGPWSSPFDLPAFYKGRLSSFGENATQLLTTHFAPSMQVSVFFFFAKEMGD